MLDAVLQRRVFSLASGYISPVSLPLQGGRAFALHLGVSRREADTVYCRTKLPSVKEAEPVNLSVKFVTRRCSLGWLNQSYPADIPGDGSARDNDARHTAQ